jgi:hypothetical protein
MSISNTVTLDGLVLDELSSGIFLTATLENGNQYELYVGHNGSSTYVKREDAGKGSGTIATQINTVASRRLENLKENGTTTTLVCTKEFEDGNIESVVFDRVKIQNPTTITSMGSKGEEDHIKREYGFTFADFRIL